jgi:outer membrane protein assembly factor BamB
VLATPEQDPDSGSGRGAAYSINPAKRGDITESGNVWQYEKINRSISTAAVGNGLAFLSDFDGILHCLDVKTGKPYWTFDLKSPVWGSPLLADGKVYLGDADGDVAVFRANSKMEKPSVIDMADSVYSTPVPANGVLYVMTRTQLYAITANKIESGK